MSDCYRQFYTIHHQNRNMARSLRGHLLDPVYNNADNNDDNIPDSPGEVLYYIPTRTGQKSTQNINLGFSATISIPLDKEARDKCMEAVALHNEYRMQMTANKRP